MTDDFGFAVRSMTKKEQLSRSAETARSSLQYTETLLLATVTTLSLALSDWKSWPRIRTETQGSPSMRWPAMCLPSKQYSLYMQR